MKLLLNGFTKFIVGLLLVGVLIFLAYHVIIALHIKNEEQVLSAQLEGYAEYKQKVKYKIIPFIW